MLNDPLANVLSKILNCERIGKREVIINPVSKMIRDVLNIFNKNNYVGDIDELTSSRGGVGKLHLLGAINKCGVIKPRFSVSLEDFEKFEKRFLPALGVGIIIISTNKGLMTFEEAKKKKLGGRLVAYCY
jgi:small subunit ribosomal protein S8